MIQVSNIGKHFGFKTLFAGLNWVINPGERVGLIGTNGSGKSTLLQILAGIEIPDEGQIAFGKGATAGYLPQDGLSLSGKTVLAEALSVFQHLLDFEKEMEQLTHKMAELAPDSAEYRKVVDRYHTVETRFQQADGYSLEAKAAIILSGLGFSKADMSRPIAEFSGGWQMRLGLAKLLLTQPSLLLLDEPTNHLDLEARNWLEEYLRNYPNAFVIASHDRYFLDVTVHRILEIWNKRTFFYTGNYDKYLLQKEQRRMQLEAAYRAQRDRIEQVEAFIKRFRYQATKAKQVQSRIKELESMERIELPSEERIIHFNFQQPRQSGRLVAEMNGVAKSYGPKQVLHGVRFVLNRGDRVALVGVNGAGKSTLMKLLAGTEPVTAGEFRLGHNVEPDYFAQDQYKALDPNVRLLDDLSSVAPTNDFGQTRLRTLLGAFLFSDDEVFKKIGVLSGGERNRYALARMLLHPTNLLLLDEPTNHLDLQAKDVLLEALQKFQGTIVFVSHDRYFIDKLATRIFQIEGGVLTDYFGNYEDYLWTKNREAADPALRSSHSPQSAEVNAAGRLAGAALSAQSANSPKGDVRAYESLQEAAAKMKVNPALIRRMERRRDELEHSITRAEADIALCEMQLSNFETAEKAKRVADILEQRKFQHARWMQEWEDLAREIESLRVPR